MPAVRRADGEQRQAARLRAHQRPPHLKKKNVRRVRGAIRFAGRQLIRVRGLRPGASRSSARSSLRAPSRPVPLRRAEPPCGRRLRRHSPRRKVLYPLLPHQAPPRLDSCSRHTIGDSGNSPADCGRSRQPLTRPRAQPDPERFGHPSRRRRFSSSQGDGAGRSAQRACERSSDWPRGAQPPDPDELPNRNVRAPDPDHFMLLAIELTPA